MALARNSCSIVLSSFNPHSRAAALSFYVVVALQAPCNNVRLSTIFPELIILLRCKTTSRRGNNRARCCLKQLKTKPWNTTLNPPGTQPHFDSLHEHWSLPPSCYIHTKITARRTVSTVGRAGMLLCRVSLRHHFIRKAFRSCRRTTGTMRWLDLRRLCGNARW